VLGLTGVNRVDYVMFQWVILKIIDSEHTIFRVLGGILGVIWLVIVGK